MFKKTLIASALMATAFTASSAVTLEFSSTGTAAQGELVSVEGLPTSGRFDIADSSDITLVAAAASDISALSNTDNTVKVKFTLTGGFFSATPLAANFATDALDGAGAVTDDATAENNQLTLAVDSGATSTSFTVTLTKGAYNDGATGATTDDDNTWAGINTAGAALLNIDELPIIFTDKTKGGSVSLVAEILTSTSVSVAKTASKKIATLVNQFSVKVQSALDSDIDVAQGRVYIKNGSTLKTDNDALVLKFETVGSGATAEEMDVTIKGNFDGIKELKDGSGNKYTINSDKTAATFEFDTSTTPSVSAILMDAAYTLTAKVDGTTVLSNRSFTASAMLDYEDSENSDRDITLADNATAGKWELNGSDEDVDFLPLDNDKFALLVSVANTSDVDGEITVDITTEGETYSKVIDAVAAANAVTNIGPDITAFAKEEGLTGFAHVKIVVNSPKDDISTKAFYLSRSDKDRAVVR